MRLRAAVEVDVETSRDTNYNGIEVVRVKYRERGSRRWTKLVVFPDEGQTVEGLMEDGALIAQAHREGLGA